MSRLIERRCLRSQVVGVPAMDTAITGATPEDIQRGLAAWDGVVDEVVVRAVTGRETIEEAVQLLEAASPRTLLR